MRRAGAWVLLALALAVVGAPPAAATDGPRITLDRAEAAPGQPIIVTLDGFTGQVATVAVCGNLAKRGSSDCNMPAAQSERIRHDDDVTLTQLLVQPPPVPCPCLVRASSTTNDEFAVASMVVTGHPTAPVVSPDSGPLVDVGVDAVRASDGLGAALRSALGGGTRYDVTVSVRNLTTETLSNVVLSGSARHRLNDEAATLDLEPAGPIEPGQTFETTVQVDLPAPVIGRFTWTVTASGAGESVEAANAMTNTPVALYVLLVVLVLDIVAMAWRFVVRRRRRRSEEIAEPTEAIAWPAPTPVVIDLREGDVVGTGHVEPADDPAAHPTGVP